MLNGLDLFSGIGGITLALAPWVKPVAYCEKERYAQAVLLSRMAKGDLPAAPIWDDVQTLRGNFLPKIDIIYGGFPCQDISAAGLGEGLGGKRSGLFFEILRLAEEIDPAFIFLENVPAIRTRGLARVCYELALLGYDIRWCTLSAKAIGAPHERNRWWLLAANTDRLGVRELRRWSSGALRKSTAKLILNGQERIVANSYNQTKPQQAGRQEGAGIITGYNAIQNTDGIGLEKSRHSQRGAASAITNPSWWATEPDVCRVVNGLPKRVDRIRGLGNAVVPAQAREAFQKLMGFEKGIYGSAST